MPPAAHWRGVAGGVEPPRPWPGITLEGSAEEHLLSYLRRGSALARRCNTPPRQAVALDPISGDGRLMESAARIEAARDRSHRNKCGCVGKAQQEVAVATFRCAYEAPAAKIRDHRYHLWLGREPSFIIVAHLVPCSIASDNEWVSEGTLRASDVPILNCKSFRALRRCADPATQGPLVLSSAGLWLIGRVAEWLLAARPTG
jgi:hypothetical protein